MFRRLREFIREFDQEVLEKGQSAAQNLNANEEVKQEYKKSEFDFKGYK
jgi:hypothetical protein